jgi:hypothetical protein
MGVRVLASLALAAVVALGGTPAAAAEAQTILHLLDYVGVDYPEAVADGKVKNEDDMFTGHGVAALQEAGVIQVTSLGFEPVTLLGIYPTAEALGAQAAVLAAVVLGCLATRRSAAAASSSAS